MNELDFSQNPENLIFGLFRDFLGPHDLTRLFFKNQASSSFLRLSNFTPKKPEILRS